MSDDIIVRTDGGAQGNPGPAASAFVVENGERIICMHAEYIGLATNNQAEYTALVMALKYVQTNLSKKKIKVFADSQLMIKQLKGEYKVKSPSLVPLWSKAHELVDKLNASLEWVERDKNRLADSLVEMIRRVKGG